MWLSSRSKSISPSLPLCHAESRHHPVPGPKSDTLQHRRSCLLSSFTSPFKSRYTLHVTQNYLQHRQYVHTRNTSPRRRRVRQPPRITNSTSRILSLRPLRPTRQPHHLPQLPQSTGVSHWWCLYHYLHLPLNLHLQLHRISRPYFERVSE